MNDELTPREKELLAKLPRERMPLGLEGRVVEAMREKGFLAKRRRMIAITNSRVAGLVAACVALVIGAYAIGLQKGEVRVVPAMEPPSRRAATPGDLEKKKTVVSGDVVETQAESPPAEVHDEERSAAGRSDGSAPAESKEKVGPDKRDVTASKTQGAVEPAPGTASDAGEKRAAATEQVKEQPVDLTGSKEAPATPAKSKTRPDEEPIAEAGGRAQPQPAGGASPSKQAESARAGETPTPTALSPGAAPKAGAKSKTDEVLPLPEGIRYDLAERRLTFLLNGTPVTVEADSVRVVEDPRGRILLIYTPDGIMRLRLAD